VILLLLTNLSLKKREGSILPKMGSWLSDFTLFAPKSYDKKGKKKFACEAGIFPNI
jgi:hypothetical protein